MGLEKFVIVVMIMNVMSLLQTGWWCLGCLEHERDALLQIKHVFNSKILSSWETNSNCCDWGLVYCDETSGRVNGLRLNYARDNNIVEDWYLNTSLFMQFEYLDFLQLAGNSIASFAESRGFHKLTKLKTLNLNSNKLNVVSVLSSLSGLQSLETLDLSNNRFEGKINLEVKDLPSLTLIILNNVTENGIQIVSAPVSLREIRMWGNKFKGPIFSEYSSRNLTNVEVLLIQDSFLDELAFRSLEYLSSLKSLSISNLNDALVTQGFPHLNNLETLKLYSSNITYSNSLQYIGLCNLNRLRELDLGNNNFKGTLPECLANLTYLESLRLASNHLQIPISLSPLFNNSMLTTLMISESEIYDDIQPPPSLIPRFQLQRLFLSGHGSTSKFPKFLYYQHSLSEIFIENVHIRGEFPHWLVENNAHLTDVSLVNLSLRGTLQLPMQQHKHLSSLDISNNHLCGHVPLDFGAYFQQLTYLDMSANNFSGAIPASISNMISLQTFDLSNNKFSGQIPFGFCSSQTREVYLNNNKIQGFSADSIFLNCSSLFVLDLSYNSLSGSIPRSISGISGILYLSLRHNYLSGEIPMALCKFEGLNWIDLSYNNLFGHIRSCLRFMTHPLNHPYQMAQKHLVGHSYSVYHDGKDFNITTKGTSRLYPAQILSRFYGIDFSCNNLTGEIPSEMGNLSFIMSLNLSHNSLSGLIPSTLSELSQITCLDLSYNKLQGRIPPELTRLTFLSSFSVAYNNLSGKTPEMVRQFGTFEASSYEGNPLLCGLPLPKSCTSNILPLSDGMKDDGDDVGFIDMSDFYASFTGSFSVILMGMFAVICINTNWRRAWFHFIEVVINNVYYFIADNFLIPIGIRVYGSLV